mgnify:CR=1 FL=1
MKIFKNKFIFIVGNSRSGTTMLGESLGNNDKIHCFKEIHFFEGFFTPKNFEKKISITDAKKFLNELIAIQEQGFYNRKNVSQFSNISDKILSKMQNNELIPILLYINFLLFWSYKNGKSIPCEQTPKNALYLKQFLKYLPNASIINMIRDPRAIALSQKFKFKRLKFGKHNFFESIREWTNYHPVITSFIWNSYINSIKKNKFTNVLNIKYEDIVNYPKKNMIKISEFCELDFQNEMLKNTNTGSSLQSDIKSVRGFDSGKINSWKQILSKEEIYIVQSITKKNMNLFKYDIFQININHAIIVIFLLSLPFKIFLSLILNFKNTNFKGALIKRLGL